MEISAFDHLVLRVDDLDAALSFYTDALGLQPLRVDEFRRGEVPFPSVRISADVLIDLVPKERAPGSNNVGPLLSGGGGRPDRIGVGAARARSGGDR